MKNLFEPFVAFESFTKRYVEILRRSVELDNMIQREKGREPFCRM